VTVKIERRETVEVRVTEELTVTNKTRHGRSNSNITGASNNSNKAQ